MGHIRQSRQDKTYRAVYSKKFTGLQMLVLVIAIVGSLVHPCMTHAQSAHERRVIKAEELISEGQVAQAISEYEGALETILSHQLSPSDRAEVGKIHSRLGQLYLKRMLKSSSGDYALEFQARAALHYLKCVQVKELSTIIRERVCAPKVEQLLAPFRVIGSPQRLEVSHPTAFRGPVNNGQLLPRGLVSILSQKTSTSPIEQRLIRIPQEGALDFTERNYMPPRPLLSNATNLVFKPAPNTPEFQLYKEALAASGTHAGAQVPIAPGVLMAGIGIAGLVTGGVIQGLQIHVPMGDQGIKALYIAGGVFTALGGTWLSWAW